jgi:predicted Zn-dependent protease
MVSGGARKRHRRKSGKSAIASGWQAVAEHQLLDAARANGPATEPAEAAASGWPTIVETMLAGDEVRLSSGALAWAYFGLALASARLLAVGLRELPCTANNDERALLRVLADMLDPAGKSVLQLGFKLRSRRQGANLAATVTMAWRHRLLAHHVTQEHVNQSVDAATAGKSTGGLQKRAIANVAQQHGISDGAVRDALKVAKKARRSVR